MKIYCKIKKDGKWAWFVGDSPWKVHVARKLCECRVCKPNFVRQEEEECGCKENWSPHKPSDHHPEEEE